jgi:hypothetical protein
LATAGDTHFGGQDFDQRLMSYLRCSNVFTSLGSSRRRSNVAVTLAEVVGGGHDVFSKMNKNEVSISIKTIYCPGLFWALDELRC